MITDNRLKLAKQKAKQKYQMYKNDEKYGRLIKSCYLSLCHSKDEWNLIADITLFNNVIKHYFNDTDLI